MPNLLETAGSRSPKQTRFAPIFINRPYGLYTNRNPLRDPSDTVTERFYGGRPGALIDGHNVELTNKLTLARRCGLSQFSSVTYPAAPDTFYAFRRQDGTIKVIVDTATSVYADNQNGTKTTILTKAAGAGQAYFQGVGNTLYFGDGVDLKKWDGTTTWNWGSVAPTVAPGVTITPSGASAVLWQANTVFSTMGLIVDGTGNVQQVVSVNASGTNTTRFGTTGNGQPAWNGSLGGTTTDNTVTWTNRGPVGLWNPATLYNNFSSGGTTANPCIIYDPATDALYGNGNAGTSGTSGATRPNFTGVNGSFVGDNLGSGSGINWFCIKPKPAIWVPSHVYTLIGSVSRNDVNCSIVEPIALSATYNPAVQATTWQVATTGGTSGSGGTQPVFATVAGQQATDGDLIWVCQGSATRATLTAYSQWGGTGQLLFGVIKDSNNNMQVCTTSGTTSATATGSITWGTHYGDTTTDGGVVWTCVGPFMSWAAATIWYLPSVGFAPPLPTNNYGGAEIKDSNSNVQAVIASGKSGSSAPSWGLVGTQTTDNAATWYCTSAFSLNSLAFTKGYGYVFAGKARLSTDPYNTTAPPGVSAPLGPPTGSQSGLVTTASTAFIMPTGANTGSVMTITGPGFTDPQIDTVVIFRSVDGSQLGGPYLFLTEINNPPTVGGAAGTWSYQDFQPDTQLNPLLEAPLNHENDPPPAGAINPVLHFNRIWVSVGSVVYASGGPDTTTGNGAEAFPPINFWSFPSNVTRLLPTSTALLVFTTSDVWAIVGGPSVTTFYAQPLVPGVGLLSYNALDQEGGLIYMFSADSQFLALDPSSGVTRTGFPISDILQSWDASKAYVTVHESGNDNAIYLADGSTGWYRLNPSQAPDGGGVWSPKATITGGCQAVLSIEISKGVHRLLVGSASGGQTISKRDLTVFTDLGTPYQADFTVGSLVVAQPGQLGELSFVTGDFTRTGTSPVVAFLLDEISGAFTTFPSSVSDPPQLYGATGGPTTLFSNRYYFSSTQVPAWCRHLQIKVSYGATDTTQNELLTLTLFAANYQDA
jgi:hypothetical protein